MTKQLRPQPTPTQTEVPLPGLSLASIDDLRIAAQARLRAGHNDTCSHELGPYVCSCGHDALGEALERMGYR